LEKTFSDNIHFNQSLLSIGHGILRSQDRMAKNVFVSRLMRDAVNRTSTRVTAD